MKAPTRWLILTFMAAIVVGLVVYGCSKDPDEWAQTPAQPVQPDGDSQFAPMAACSTDATLDDEDDIEAWVTDACCGAVLTVIEGSYSFSTLGFMGTGCQAATIDGSGSTFNFSGTLPPDIHAQLWFTENINKPNIPSRLEDIDLVFSGLTSGDYGLEFELCYAEMDGVSLSGNGQSRLHGVLGFIGDDVTIAYGHTLFVNGYPDGALLENSTVNGKIEIDAGAPFASAPRSLAPAVANTFTFSNNTIKAMELNSNIGLRTVELTGNTFTGSGATVSADDDITIIAEENTNSNATCRCESDAEAAFTITGNSTLDLRSWEYHASGVQDSIWGITEITDISSTRICNEMTVTWTTDFYSTSRVEWGYSSGSLVYTAYGNDATSHSVDFDVAGDEETVYFKVISGPPGCPADEVESTEQTNTDGVYVPSISGLQYERDPMTTMTVTWSTDCEATSKVVWGYSSGSLTNTATGATGTSHSVQFGVASNEGCIYFKAVSENPDDQTSYDETAEQIDATTVVISNVQRSWNSSTCRAEITWTTNVKSSSVAIWDGGSCTGNVAYGTGNTTSHFVTFEAPEFRRGQRIYVKAKSETACAGPAYSSCGFLTKGWCLP